MCAQGLSYYLSKWLVPTCLKRPALTLLLGSLSTGQGTRCAHILLLHIIFSYTRCSFVLADTEHLHRKIGEMGHRIRSLEDALAIFQAGVSTDVHPLLTDELLAVKYGLEATPRETSADHQAVSIDGLGTLTISEEGDSHYFGRTGASEVSFAYESHGFNGTDDPYPRRRSFWSVLFALGGVSCPNISYIGRCRTEWQYGIIPYSE